MITGKMSRAFSAAKRPFQRGQRGRPSTVANRGGNRGGRRQFAVETDDYEVEAMEYGVTTDNPSMMTDLMSDEAWNDQAEIDYDYGEEA